jgi:hypothetical protein
MYRARECYWKIASYSCGTVPYRALPGRTRNAISTRSTAGTVQVPVYTVLVARVELKTVLVSIRYIHKMTT